MGKVIYEFGAALDAKRVEKLHADGERVKQQVREAMARSAGYEEGRREERSEWHDRAGRWLWWVVVTVLVVAAAAFGGGVLLAIKVWR